MADAAPKQSESMEDILQSIKRIIEDDTAPEAKSAAVPVPPPVFSADILELTQMVKDDGTVTELSPLPSAAMRPEPVKPAVVAAAAMPVPAPAVPIPAPQPPHPEEGLVSDHAAKAAMAALRPIVEGGHKDYSIPHIPSSALRNGNTVEDLVLEALKPMLKAWLDEHLPLIVQKIVEKEVKRIVTFHND